MIDTRKFSRLWLGLVLLLFSGSLAWGQSVSDATITGTVTLPSGERMQGATIKIASSALVTGERTVMSDAQGRFVFLSLPPGTYSLSASLQGFKTFATRDVVLHSGDKRDLEVKLEVGTFEEAITVSGAAPIVDTRASTTDTTFSEEMLEKLPTSRDAFYDLALTAPGVASVGSDETWLRSPSAYGSAGNENIFLVNGVNATNPRGAPWGSLVQVNYNTVEEVKVLALGSKAEYGSFSGAAIDVLTKSGGNEFQGDVAYYSLVGNAADNTTLDFGSTRCSFCKDEANGRFYAELDVDLNDDLNYAPEDSWEASATLGGPILRDRLWFYGGFAKYDSATDTALFEPLSLWESELWDLKLTGELGPQHRAWFAYHSEDNRVGNVSWGATWDPSMVYNQGRENDTLQAQYQWVISDRDLFSAKYLGFDYEEHPTIPNENGRPGFINWWKYIGGQSVGVAGDFPYIENQISDRKTVQADYTHYAAQFLGEHEVKFGVQYTGSEANWLGGYFHGYANFAYPYPYSYGPATSWWWNHGYWGTQENPVVPFYNMKYTRNPWLTVRQADSTGAFIDDTWTLSDRLTFDIGLRFDNMTAKYGEGAMFEPFETPDDIRNPVKTRTREGTDDIFDFDTWSPRLGLAWTLTEDRRTVLRAHVGRYFAPMGVETLRRLGPDMDPTQIDHLRYFLPLSAVDLNGNGMIDFNETRPATRLLAGRAPDQVVSSFTQSGSWSLEVAPGLDSPYTDQFNISLQRQLGADMAIELGYIFKETKDMIAFKPYNTATGEFWEWQSKPFETWTGFQTEVWEVVLKDYNGDGAVNADDAEFVLSNWGVRAVNMDEFAGQEAHRTYNGLQLVLNKRYSNRWQALAAVNWNDSDGFAPRTRDQNWYIDGPMIMDTQFGLTLNQFQNNMEGPLPMTPELMVKISGSYTIPRIETDVGLRYRYDSGRAIFPIQDVPAWATWMGDLRPDAYLSGPCCVQYMVATNPNEADFTPPTSIVDLSLQKGFTLGGGYGVNVSFDVLNALNENAPNRFGVSQGDYGRVYGLVQPRIYRAGIKFLF
jgi:hypothetical protein